MSSGFIEASNQAVDSRTKNFRLLNEEEHQFISLDCKLFPDLYKPGFKPFPRYDLQVPRERIIELIQLPEILQFALGFITTQNELQAHLLVNKYYKVKRSSNYDNEFIKSTFDSFETVNTCNDDEETPLLSMEKCGKKLYHVSDCTEEMKIISESNLDFFDLMATLRMNALLQSNEGNEAIVFQNLEDFANCKQSLQDKSAFIEIDESIPFHSISSTSINSNEKRRHIFVLNDDDERKKFSSITVSIACQGMFEDGVYQTAHISAALKKTSSQHEHPSLYVGNAPHSLQVINSKTKLGHVRVKYDLENSGRLEIPTKHVFELYIISKSACQYSIDVTCVAAYDANDITMNEFYNFFTGCKRKRQEELNETNVQLDIRILKKKMKLLENLIEEAERLRNKCEKDIDAKELEMDLTDDIIRNYGSQQAEIKKLELNHSHQCRLISVRKNSIQELTTNMARLQKEESNHFDLTHQFEQKSINSLSLLPMVIEKILNCEMREKSRNVLASVLMFSNPIAVNETSSTVHKNSIFPSLSDEKERAAKFRLLLQEIDRIDSIKNDRAASAMLHATPQLFPQKVLKVNLEVEMHKMLCQDIYKYESNHPLMMSQENDSDENSIDTFDSQEDYKHRNDDKNGFLPEDHLEGIMSFQEKKFQTKDSPRLDNLINQREELDCEILSLKKERREARKKAGGKSNEFVELEDKIRCLSICKTRVEEKLKLSAVDKELRSAEKSISKYYVVRALHGYETLMHKSEAIVALSAEQNRLVAILTSKEIIDDILDRMLKGWHFGIVGRDEVGKKIIPEILINDETNKAIKNIDTRARVRARSEFNVKQNLASSDYL